MMLGHWGYGFGWGGPMFGFGPLLFLLVVAAVLYVVLRGRAGPAESARDILERRYAKGEISKEQFEQMKRDLG